MSVNIFTIHNMTKCTKCGSKTEYRYIKGGVKVLICVNRCGTKLDVTSQKQSN